LCSAQRPAALRTKQPWLFEMAALKTASLFL
jgi:hypothetical protein